MAISKIVYKESPEATPVTWMDATPATAGAADIMAPKTAMLADGVMTTGTGSGSGGTADYKAFIERSTNTPTLPSDLTSIAANICRDWTGLTLTSLPNSVTTIGDNAFQNCANLALTSLPSNITTIGNYAFSGCTSIILTSLPSNLTTINSYAFRCCTGIETISSDARIIGIGSAAFSGSSTDPMALREVYFPNASIGTLGPGFGNSTAAAACQQLEIADMGKTGYISANAFANCYKLQTLVLRKTGVICTLANTSAFTNTPMSGYNSLTGTVYVPNALIATYQTATNWKTLYDAGYISFVKIEGSIYE